VLDTTVQPLTLEHPLVQQAKAKWEAGHVGSRRPKHGKSFDYFFKKFTEDKISFAKISTEVGVSRQSICELYNRTFAALFGNSTGQERFLSGRKKLRLKRLSMAERKLLSEGALKRISKLAKSAGLPVVALPQAHSPSRLTTRFLCINGRKCLIRQSEAIFSPREKMRYFRFTLKQNSLREADFAILYAKTKKSGELIFVLPVAVLRAAHYPKSCKGSKSVYVPDKRVKSHHSLPKVDYWDYENAWHLLVPPKKRSKKQLAR
jgi:AraC-like DNA-binding protein